MAGVVVDQHIEGENGTGQEQKNRSPGGQKTNEAIVDDTGDVKVNYSIEEDTPPSQESVTNSKLTNLRQSAGGSQEKGPPSEEAFRNSKLSNIRQSAGGSQEKGPPSEEAFQNSKLSNIRQSAGGSQERGPPSEEAFQNSKLSNIRQSAGGTQEITTGGSSSEEELQRRESGKKVLRGEELGTGYESDDDSTGP